jgi:hypothetical protein
MIASMRKRLEGTEGHLLISTVIFLFLTGLIGFAFMSSSAHEAYALERDYEELRTFWRAEEGLARAAARVTSSQPVTTTILAHGDEDFITVETDTTGDTLISLALRMAGSDTLAAVRLVALVSTVAMITDLVSAADPGKPYYHSGDVIDGPLHFNGTLNVTGSPRFLDEVKLGIGGFQELNWYEKGSRKALFEKGITFNAPTYSYSGFCEDIRAGADKRFAAGSVSEVVFEGDMIKVRRRSHGATAGYGGTATYSLYDYDTFFFEDSVEVRGTVGATVTIGSEAAVTITDDLVYEGSDPETAEPPGNDVVLGLISENDVLVRKDQAKALRDGGIRINAAIAAENTSFRTANIFDGHMGTMYFWGSIAEKKRDTHGYILYDRYKYGYTRKDWHYDRRFIGHVPPAYPIKRDRSGTPMREITYWNRDGRY